MWFSVQIDHLKKLLVFLTNDQTLSELKILRGDQKLSNFIYKKVFKLEVLTHLHEKKMSYYQFLPGLFVRFYFLSDIFYYC